MIDPRGSRFAAGVTSVVLAAALLTGSAWLLAAQVGVFAVTAAIGVGASPYGRLYALAVRPRIGPPVSTEDERPPRFAQAVGFVFSAVGLVGLLAGVPVLFHIAVGAALAAAFLNAGFGFCLGCELYLLARRISTRNTEVITP